MPPTETLEDPTEPLKRFKEGDFEYRRREQDLQDEEGGQALLFPQSDLVVPDGVLRFRKAVAAIHAIPLSTDVSLNTRRIFDALILVAQMDIRQRGPGVMERIKNERYSPMFEVRINDLSRLAGIKGKNYKRIYEDLDDIYEMSLQWNIVAEDATVEWNFKAHFLATYGRGTGPNLSWIRFSIDPEILSIVLDPANWATLSLSVLRGMSTLASYQLYQNCWRYINTTQKVTAALPVETWIELIMGGPSRFVKIDPTSQKKVASEYRDFKRRYLLDAMERVNATAALDHTIELKEIRSGNRVARLQFKFIAKKQQRLELPIAWDNALVDRLRVLGFTAQDISELAQLHSGDKMTQALLALSSAKERIERNNQKMSSPTAYLRGILERMTTASDEENALHPSQDQEHLRALELERREAERATELNEAFAQHNRNAFRQALRQAPEELVQRCQAIYTASPAYANDRFVIERAGWDSPPATALLGGWLRQHEPALYATILPHEKDRELLAWMAAEGKSVESAPLALSADAPAAQAPETPDKPKPARSPVAKKSAKKGT